MDTSEVSTGGKAANFCFVFIWLSLAILLILFKVSFLNINDIVIATKINPSHSAEQQIEIITDAIIVLKHLQNESRQLGMGQ